MSTHALPAELTFDAITRDFRIYQRRRGHRYSLDDLATAHRAVNAVPEALRVLDLGCGIGSVLLMVAWRLSNARVYGIEALPESAALARRSIEENHLRHRAEVISGDLREVTAAWPHARCDLVTGTPPYLPPGTALASPDPQRSAARIELRGGIEDYLAAASRVLADHGRAVVCADGRTPERVIAAAERANLHPRHRLDVWPRPGKSSPLLSVWTFAQTPGPLEHDPLLVRDDAGQRTEAATALRATFGL